MDVLFNQIGYVVPKLVMRAMFLRLINCIGSGGVNGPRITRCEKVQGRLPGVGKGLRRRVVPLVLSKKIRGQLGTAGCPERRKSGGYGVLVVRMASTRVDVRRKGGRNNRIWSHSVASELGKLGYTFSVTDGKIVNLLTKVSNLEILISAYNHL
jgi:hypothetical protein